MLKYITQLILLIFVQISFGHDLPKVAYGKYGGEMPSYEIEMDGMIMNINAHDVFITITESEIIYKGENLVFSGEYSVFKENKSEHLIKSTLSNGKSLEYRIDFIWNKKDQQMYMTARKGES